MRVVLSQAAIADLRDIGHWIALDHPERAVTFVQELARKCAELGEAPLPYPLAPEAGEGVRKRRHGRYLILYHVGAEAVEVLHVVHGMRAYRNLFLKM
jgi:plasmid stabilization system protein ParE